MVTTRSALAGGCLTLAMLTAAACVQATNLVADRELVCDRIPDALCLRIVKVGFMQSRVDTAEREFGPLTKITVRGCKERGGAVQCWVVDVTTEEGAGTATKVIQLSNGSLVRAE